MTNLKKLLNISIKSKLIKKREVLILMIILQVVKEDQATSEFQIQKLTRLLNQLKIIELKQKIFSSRIILNMVEDLVILIVQKLVNITTGIIRLMKLIQI